MAEFQYGDDVVGFFTAQTTYQTPVSQLAAGAFRATSITINPSRNRFYPQDQAGSRAASPGVQGRGICTWNASTLIRGSGVPAVPYDIGNLLKHAFGSEVTTPGVSGYNTYSFLKDTTGLFGALHKKGSTIHEHCYGAIITQIAFAWGNDQPMTMTLTGKARDGGMTYPTAANGAGSSATALILDAGDAIQVGSLLKIAADDNSGAGHVVTAVNVTTSTATLAAAKSWSDDAVVVPFLPVPTLAGAPLYGNTGSISFDGGSTSVSHLSGSLTIDTGADLLEDEYGDEYATEVVMRGKRSTSFNLDFLLKEANAEFASQARRRSTKDVHIIFGQDAGATMTFDMPIVEFTGGNPDSPETGPMRYQLQGIATGTDAALEDECTLKTQ